MNDRSFEGKVALITGGGAGIGQGVAMAFAAAGARVVAADLSEEWLEETISAIRAEGGQAIAVKADVSDAADAEAMVASTIREYGALDHAFNNAGIVGKPGIFTADIEDDMFNQVLNVNLTGTWLCMKHQIRAMLERGKGSIVNASSAAGMVGMPGRAAYSATKHGIIGLTRTAALEYGRQGIRINAIAPGGVKTELSRKVFESFSPEKQQALRDNAPSGRTMAEVGEVATAVLWLSSDQAAFVLGSVLTIDGGYTAA